MLDGYQFRFNGRLRKRGYRCNIMPIVTKQSDVLVGLVGV